MSPHRSGLFAISTILGNLTIRKKNMVILIDQDGVLADFEQGIIDEWRRRYPSEPFVPISERKNFYAQLDYEEEKRYRIDEIMSACGFFLNLNPVPGGIEAVKEILGIGHDVRICTAPISNFENCVREKYLWVEKFFGREFTRRIIISKDKTFVRGNFLIDDRPSIENSHLAEWEHVLFDAPYNLQVSNKRRMTWKNWKEVLGLQATVI